MAEMSVFWLRLAVLLYGAGLIDAILFLLKRRADSSRIAQVCFQIAAIFHFVSIVEHSIALRHLAAKDDQELKDLGIDAARKSPLETFLERRNAARKNSGL